jgi:hypothetical protein
MRIWRRIVVRQQSWTTKMDTRVRPRLREHALAGQENLPPQARPIAGLVESDVMLIALEIHGTVVDPHAGQPWQSRSARPLVANAFAQTVTRCQQQAVELSAPHDQDALHWADEADDASRAAEQAAQEADKILDTNITSIDGGMTTSRAVLAEHKADLTLAAERKACGDNRHAERPIERAWILLAAFVFGALDLLLLWRPVFGLTLPPDSSTMIFKWCMALFFTLAQALFVDFAVQRFHDREQVSTDRRNAVLDRNRALRAGDFSRTAPDETQLREADHDYRQAMYLLIATAMMMGLIGAVRVAKITREGARTVAEATLFGAVIGLILAGMILLVAWLACRSNDLGRRLCTGAHIVAEIDERFRRAREHATDSCAESRRLLARATDAQARASEEREWVMSAYRQAMLLAAGWLGLDWLPEDSRELAVTRILPVRQEAERKVLETDARLVRVDEWLAGHLTIADHRQPALPASATTPGSAALPALRTRVLTTDHRLVPIEQQLEPAPRIPVLLLAVGGAAVILAAFLTAHTLDPAATQTLASTPFTLVA